MWSFCCIYWIPLIMAAKKKGTKGKERPPPVDKLILPAIGVGLALLAYQFFVGIKAEVCLEPVRLLPICHDWSN